MKHLANALYGLWLPSLNRVNARCEYWNLASTMVRDPGVEPSPESPGCDSHQFALEFHEGSN
jgi:hypothetical protein